MKKTITEKILCPTTLCLGILGLVMRFWLYGSGMEKSGLLDNGHPANIMIYGLLFLTLGLLIYSIFRCPKALHSRFPASIPAACGCFIAAVGILITNILELGRAGDRITQINALLGVLAAAGLFYMGLQRKQGNRSPMIALTAIILYFMTHLVVQYRHWSAEPQLQHYLFPLLASVSLMLFAYHRSALDVSGTAFRRYVFFNQASLFFCCMALDTDSWLFYAAMAVWTCTDLYIPKKDEKKNLHIPRNVKLCMDKLTEAGYESYMVGGCVRDALLQKQPQDYDLCTNALPQEICEVFKDFQLVRSGEKHGTIGVVIHKQVYEITTFRTEGGYTDSRHPDWVKFVPTIEEDLARRDFTVNAMAYHPHRGLVDPWGGQKDLQERCLRTVGEPTHRFTEDPLRILRGVRFAVRYDLTPEENTKAAMLSMTEWMDHLARERVFDELCKLLPKVSARDLIRFAPVITQVIPELIPCVDFDQQNPHHAYDVYTHIAHTVEAVPETLALRWAALFHDLGKPETFTKDADGIGHFYGHEEQSAILANQILLRLKAPNALRDQVAFLVEAHGLVLPPDKKVLRRRLSKFGKENIQNLLLLQMADRKSTGVDRSDTDELVHTQAVLEMLLQEESCLQIKDLAVNGEDLMQLGIPAGPQLGQTLNRLLDMVLNEELPNEAAALLAEAKKNMQ